MQACKRASVRAFGPGCGGRMWVHIDAMRMGVCAHVHACAAARADAFEVCVRVYGCVEV